jgi:hypothetical protein
MVRISSLSPRQNLIVAAVVRAVADAAMEDKLVRAITVRAGRRPDDERLLFAIVDGLEDYRLTAPSFILRRAQQVLCAREVVRRATRPVRTTCASPAPKVEADVTDGVGDFAVDVPTYAELG